PPPAPTLFPYTTLFRSLPVDLRAPDMELGQALEDRCPIIVILFEGGQPPSLGFRKAGLGRGEKCGCWRDLDEGRDFHLGERADRSEEHTSELQSRFDLV